MSTPSESPAGHRKPGSARRFALIGAAAAVVAAVGIAASVLPGRSSSSVSPASAPAADAASAPTSSSAAAPAASVKSSASAKASAAAPKTAGGCARTIGPTPVTRVTQVSVGSAVHGYGGEGDTEPLPMAIAATPSGGSWLAWLGTDARVHLGKLGCDDKLIGKPTTFTGIDLQDIQADATGGVLLLTRKGDCHTGPLCGGTSSPCNKMFMVRFDNAGRMVWERQVTNLTGARGGYDDGARFVWWYQHHGRLASDGSNYAAYFGVAITV